MMQKGKTVSCLGLLFLFVFSLGCVVASPCLAETEGRPVNAVGGGKPYILTPKPSLEPRINGARVFGVRPGNPFLYTIPATGKRPMSFAADDLPDGLQLESGTGKISGRIAGPGEYRVTLRAKNELAEATREFRIVVGDNICLTPPMGWNSWNCWAKEVDDEKVRETAKAMVDSGLIDHGWTYINIDDAWQGPRGGTQHAIQPNDEFPDMKALCDYVHSLGLKIGTYSTPYITSYAGFIGGSSDNKESTWTSIEGWDNYKKNHRVGKFTFEENDARQWAEWGIDYLKYDWCPNDVPATRRMAEALRACGRDIVYSLSNDAMLAHAPDYIQLANCWRTTKDIRDHWDYGQTTKTVNYQGIADIWRFHPEWQQYNGPGHWNDPDMLVVGQVGWGELRPSNLTPDEQYAHISLWCLWSAPLLIGCPIDKLDEFTLNLLTNDEVLEVNQDPLGIQAGSVARRGDHEVLAKDMENGSKAVGLFNRGESADFVTVRWSDLGITGRHRVRDLWRQKDLGIFDGEFSARVASHGVVLVRMTPVD